MRIAGIKIKRSPRKKITQGMKVYDFICPVSDVEIGDYVLCEVKSNSKQEHFAVGKIVYIKEEKTSYVIKHRENKPTDFVICKIDMNPEDFDKRIRQMQILKYRTLSLYNGNFKVKNSKNSIKNNHDNKIGHNN